MKQSILYSIAAFFSGVLLLCAGNVAFGQGLMNTSKSGKNPMVIHSDAMDMDMANNIITMLGNVDVTDPGMNIKCRKMIVYLYKKGEGNKSSDTDTSNVREIECIGDVVITQRKENSSEAVQQAFAGKAHYFVQEEKIVLTEEPVVVKGNSRLEGEKITMYTKTDRVIVVRPVTTLRNNQSTEK